MGTRIYSIDTSSLIDLRAFPAEFFAGLWRDIENAIRIGELVSTVEVFRELKKIDDMVSRWAKDHKEMFMDVTKEHVLLAQEILRTHKGLVDIEKGKGNADPFVIALALEGNRNQEEEMFGNTEYVVVTQERKRQGGNPSIPNVCEFYEIECMDLFGYFREKDWHW